MLISLSFALLGGLFMVPSVRADSVTLTPVADTYISEHFVGPNGSSADLVMGKQGLAVGGALNRGLVKFDLTFIPTNAFIDSVSLRVTVNRIASGGVGSLFHLHVVKVPWTESAATWFVRSAGQNWVTPGGARGMDYAEDSSGNAFVGGTGATTFETTTGLVADVTAWLNSPASNYGWLIKTEDESVEKTAGRFGARENPNTSPQLTVQYTVPPSPPQINSVSIEGTNFCVNFQGVGGSIYVLESRADIASGDWATVASSVAEADGPQQLCDPLVGPKRFYRLGVLRLGRPVF